jgi:hypothetical protein
MTIMDVLSQASDLSDQDYCVLGLATCFFREEGQIQQVEIIEPIPSAALEAILKKIPTSYKIACAKKIGDILSENEAKIPAEFPENAQFCSDFSERLIAAARTYKKRPSAQTHINLNTIRDDFNYSLERKRILNAENIVKTEDNVKQHAYTHKVL